MLHMMDLLVCDWVTHCPLIGPELLSHFILLLLSQFSKQEGSQSFSLRRDETESLTV